MPVPEQLTRAATFELAGLFGALRPVRAAGVPSMTPQHGRHEPGLFVDSSRALLGRDGQASRALPWSRLCPTTTMRPVPEDEPGHKVLLEGLLASGRSPRPAAQLCCVGRRAGQLQMLDRRSIGHGLPQRARQLTSTEHYSTCVSLSVRPVLSCTHGHTILDPGALAPRCAHPALERLLSRHRSLYRAC